MLISLSLKQPSETDYQLQYMRFSNRKDFSVVQQYFLLEYLRLYLNFHDQVLTSYHPKKSFPCDAKMKSSGRGPMSMLKMLHTRKISVISGEKTKIFCVSQKNIIFSGDTLWNSLPSLPPNTKSLWKT